MSIKKFILLLLQIMLFGTVSRAQERHMLHWGVDDGLAGSSVYCSLQDREGFMWFGTDQGLCRFDGTNFKTYTVADGLSDNDVFSLREDAKGRIWIICFNSTPCYMENGAIHRYYPGPGLAASDSRDFPSAIDCKPDGNVLLLLPQTLLILDPALRVREKYGFSSHVFGMAFTSDLVVVEQDDSIFRISGGKKTVLYVKKEGEGIAHGIAIRGDKVYFNLVQSTSRRIVSLNIKDGSGFKTVFATNEQIFNLKFLTDSTVWAISNEMAFIANINKPAHTVTLLTGKSPTSLSMDRDSNTWIGTLGSGIYMIPRSSMTVFDLDASHEEKEALSICGDGKGRIVAGFRFSSVEVFENGKVISHLRYPIAKNAFRILSIKSKGGNFFLGTDQTFLMLDKHLNFKNAFPPHLLGNVKNFDFTKQGGILIANTQWAFVLHPDQKTDAVLNQRATSVAVIRDGYYAIGTIMGLYMSDSGKVYKYGRSRVLSSSRVSDIAVDSKGKIWVSTNPNGIFCINGDSVRNISTNDGLSSNLCKKLFIDSSDNVWVCTNKGLNKIEQTSSGNISTSIFDISYGLPTNEINDVYVDKGDIWVATAQGVADFRERSGSPNPLPIHILSFYVHDSLYHTDQPLNLTYRDNDIRVDYAGISFTSGRNIQYKYLLKGTSAIDTVFTTAGSIRFGALSQGLYTLYLWAANNNKIWSDVPAEVSFRIYPPFWQTPWFYLLLASVLTLIVWSVIMLRISAIKRKEREKSAINKRISELELQALRAQMNPHFIFNALNSIQSFYLNNDDLSANKYMTTFSALIRQILHSSSKNLISVKDEITLLTNYTELEKMRFKGKFDYRIILGKGVLPEKVYLPVMLLQPYVENAVNHGLRFAENGQGLLNISFEMDEHMLVCTIDDNGIGFNAARLRRLAYDSSHIPAGMNITRKRIDAINTLYAKSIEITFTDKAEHDINTSGVTVVIRLPVINQNKSGT